MPFRLVTNTTSRSRAMLVDRMRGYGFAVEADEIFTRHPGRGGLARERGFRVVAPFFPAPALEDLAGLDLVGGSSGKAGGAPEAVILGDLGEGWTYGLLQEAFEYVMAGASIIALSRDRYWQRGGRLALDAGPFVAALEYATGSEAAVAGKPSPAFYAGRARGALALTDPGPGRDGGRRPLVRRAGRAAGRPSGLAGAHREIPGGDAARLGHHARPGAVERGRAAGAVSRNGGIIFPRSVRWE